MRRFDRTESGESLGFEDMAPPMGRSAKDTYLGKYANIVKAIVASPASLSALLVTSAVRMWDVSAGTFTACTLRA